MQKLRNQMRALGAAVLLLAVGGVGSLRPICSETGRDCNDSVQLRKLLSNSLRIVGGDDARKGRFPYMVSLMTSFREHLCGGVLINRRWVLTVAHCFFGDFSLSRNPLVLLGALDVRSSPEERGVEEMIGAKVITHKKYDPNNHEKGFDIALVKLPRKTKNKVLVNLPAADSHISESQLLLALGWGRTGRGTFPNILQQVDLEVLSTEHCQSNWDQFQDIDILESMMCSFSRRADTCAGDSGGPLLEVNTRKGRISEGNPNADIVHGLVSFGSTNCTEFNRAAVNTRVASYKNWILKSMGKRKKRKNKDVAPIRPATLPPLPPLPPLPLAQGECPKYVVKAGDTCYRLWEANGLTERELKDLNPQLNSQCFLRIGDELCLTKGLRCRKPYVVEVGDFCYDLRVTNNLSQQRFEELNPNLPPSCLIFPGQTICLG